MSPPLTTRRVSILYHSLGKQVDEGLAIFDTDFGDAEAEYRLQDVETLLEVIRDRTLQDERLVHWHHYYAARAALLLWQLDEAAAHLEAIGSPGGDDRQRLEPRLKLLDGQLKVMAGQWAAGRGTLKKAIAGFRDAGERTLPADAYEYMAQAYLMQAQGAGSWAGQQLAAGARIGRWLARLSSLPVLAVLFVVLWIQRAPLFFAPAVRFAGDFTNWPVFRDYLYAFRALQQARRLADRADPERRFRLDLMQAELLRSLTAYDDAYRAYTGLHQAWQQGSPYQKALINHGRARALMEMQASGIRVPDDDHDSPKAMLEQARETYARFKDERAMAHVDLLLGDLALTEGRVDEALDRWGQSVRVAAAKREPVGLADGLDRCYRQLGSQPVEGVADRLLEIIEDVDTKAFSARLPNRLFRALRWTVWLAPLLAVIAGLLLMQRWLGTHERSSYRDLATLLLSWRGLVGALALVLLSMAVNSAVGVIGLLATLFVPATRLDTFTIDDQGLAQVDAAGGRVAAVAWDGISAHLRVQRAVWSRPTAPLSFDCLRSEAGPPVSVPATTRWFGQLQDEIEEHTGKKPQVYALKAFGGLPVIYLGLAFPVTFVILDLAFYPTLSVDAHAITAVAYMLASFLAVAYVTHRWIGHYVRVYRQTVEPVQFAVVAWLVGILLVVLSFVFARAVYPLQALPAAWGISVLAHWVSAPGASQRTRRQWQLERIGQAAILLCGLLLLWQQVAPTLLHLAAFTYGGAVQKLDPDQPGEAAERRLSFQHMAAVSRWMLAIDGDSRVAPGFLAVAEHAQGNYAAAIAAYTDYLDRTEAVEMHDCRALAYAELGRQQEAREDWTAYGTPCDMEPHYCDRYFPQARDRVCEP